MFCPSVCCKRTHLWNFLRSEIYFLKPFLSIVNQQTSCCLHHLDSLAPWKLWNVFMNSLLWRNGTLTGPETFQFFKYWGHGLQYQYLNNIFWVPIRHYSLSRPIKQNDNVAVFHKTLFMWPKPVVFYHLLDQGEASYFICCCLRTDTPTLCI